MNVFEWDENTPVTANNLNEMQNIINNNIKDIYSTSEIKTNKVWINNKPVYRKVYEFGVLPNATSSSISSNLSNIKMTHIYGIAIETNNTTIPLPYATPTLTNNVSLRYTSDNKIAIDTGVDRTNFVGYVVLEYTKNNDTN